MKIIILSLLLLMSTSYQNKLKRKNKAKNDYELDETLLHIINAIIFKLLY